jgi:hypothetical protein
MVFLLSLLTSTMPPSNENVKRVAFILAREQVASIHRVAEKGSSRKTGFRQILFTETARARKGTETKS